MAKLYKAVDEVDGKMTKWLVIGRSVAISSAQARDEESIQIAKRCENIYDYKSIEEFHDRAIDPILIAEW